MNSGVFSLGKQARFTLNFCSRMPLRKVHELAFLWFGLPGRLLKDMFRGRANREVQTVNSQQDTKECLNQMGYLNWSFPGVKKEGIKGEVKRGEVVGE